jgi:hypothetical protein
MVKKIFIKPNCDLKKGNQHVKGKDFQASNVKW